MYFNSSWSYLFPFIALKTWYHRPGGLTHMFDATLPERCLISQSYLSSFPLVQYVTNLVEVVTFFLWFHWDKKIIIHYWKTTSWVEEIRLRVLKWNYFFLFFLKKKKENNSTVESKFYSEAKQKEDVLVRVCACAHVCACVSGEGQQTCLGGFNWDFFFLQL